MFKKFVLLAAIVSLVLGGMLVSGCSTGEKDNNGTGQETPISPQPAETKEVVTLYFSDDQAMYLVAEEREVTKTGETLAELVVNELIKGPDKEGLHKTVPPEAKLLSISVVDGVAFANFSKEIQTKHWGGSTGETFTIYSIVNSLCKLEGIESVQLLVEGDKLDSLAGHYDCSEPFEPDWTLIKE